MGVALERQELNNDKIPYLVEKCMTYVERHGEKIVN